MSNIQSCLLHFTKPLYSKVLQPMCLIVHHFLKASLLAGAEKIHASDDWDETHKVPMGCFIWD